MLELKFIRENLAQVKEGVEAKGVKIDWEKLLQLDEKRRTLLSKISTERHTQRQVSEKIALLKKEGKSISEAISEMKEVSEGIKKKETQLRQIEGELHELLSWIPNLPHSSTPRGKGANENVEIKRWGKFPKFSYQPLPHWEIAQELDLLNFQQGAKVAGSYFPLYKGIGARLERALINFMLDLHTKKHRYQEVFPPFLANRKSMFGTGQLPKLDEDMYHLKEDDLFLIPTAEVPLTNLHYDEILKEEALPLSYTAYSACFRYEAGSYGRETRGLLRVHQFNKVELVKFTRPEDSYQELEKLLQDACEVLELLNLPYRVVALCSGDLSYASAKTYDIEAWAPAQGSFLEVSSCSNFESYQARRAKIRFRRTHTKRVEFVHTLNGSGVATARLYAAILENYQTKDGKVVIPEVLRPYLDGKEIIEKGN
jgi:seryl-tRNA synthetase